ncbi:DUF547 domain-containing protein [Lusitaniella coriacea]|uniref:DUF547 domain-containing protein n=1 Tax=Lusitaniella coriacea TaxID=1983105 RepID=UPI002D21BCD5|nr:DUF547 domain-containing protein [Lusitaniella coriacea]
MKTLALLSALLLVSGCTGSLPFTQAEINNSPTANAEMGSDSFNYDDFAGVLKTHVNEQGWVDYEGLQSNRQQLDKFVVAMSQVPSGTYEGWNEREKIAFLINAYNAFTLQSIIDQDPLKKSIREIPGVWKIRKFSLAGQEKTLDNIEHQILREKFNEPRIHAALVCAAVSCPPLRTEPYTAAQLDFQLDEQVRIWLARPQGLQIEREREKVSISAIFDWFGEDWVPSYGVKEKFSGNERQRATLNFISRYISPVEAQYLEEGNYELNYLDYDWSLNRQN